MSVFKKRTPEEWADYCYHNFQGGYTPGGKARDLYKTGRALARLLRDWGVWRRDDVIVDVGCGNGRLAMGLIGEGVTYYGLDVVRKSIDFCRTAFDGYGPFRFYHLDVCNGHYNPQGKHQAQSVTYPLADHVADVVVANSLFSHTETTQIARRNLQEMNRILKVGGRLFTTWRLVPPLSEVCADARYTNYRYDDALAMIAEAGFGVLSQVNGLPKEIEIPSTNREQIGFLAIKM